MDCPECGKTLVKNKNGNYACPNCGGCYVPKTNHSGPNSMFGIT